MTKVQQSRTASVPGILLLVAAVATIAGLAWVLKRPAEAHSETPTLPVVVEAPRPIAMAHVHGVVRLREGVDPPKFDPSPTGRGGSAWPEGCTPPKLTDAVPYTFGHGRTIGRVPVIATGTDGDAWPAIGDPVVHEVRVVDCRLTPAIILAARGDTMRLINDTQWPFFPAVGEAVTRSLMRGEPRDVTLTSPGMFPLECPVMGACGRSDVVVLNHRVAVVTSDVGEFALDVPANQQITLMVLHPLFDAAVETFTLAEHATREVEFSLLLPPPPAVDPGNQIP